MERILIVDDDPGFRNLLETILVGEGYAVESAGSVGEALRAGARRKHDLVISDLKLPDGDGLEVLRWWAENLPETPVIMVTGFGTIASAVEAMKLGAVDYLGKPLSGPDELRLLVRRALDQQQTAGQCQLLREEEAQRFTCGDMVANDPKMKRVLELVRRVAPTGASVLISGESGTGKELIARCIHRNSPRSEKVFVPVNCAALSPTLIESELFGHERGSFTGAVGQHLGRFERAHGGTLFLDEIGELDGNLQAKLLRVLQEKTFERVGGTREIAVDVRVIAATNCNLEQAGGGREVSRGPVLQAQHLSHRGSASAGTALGHPGAGTFLPGEGRAELEEAAAGAHPGSRAGSAFLRLARERARTGEHHGAGRHPVR